jgi:LAO/AO transport system kinase
MRQRLISLAENDGKARAVIATALKPFTGRAYRVGITGPPGCGKSTLINAMIGMLRKSGKRVGVLLNDPTSPFTGGALLGDRIRMHGHYGDDGVVVEAWRHGKARAAFPGGINSRGRNGCPGNGRHLYRNNRRRPERDLCQEAVHTVVVVLAPQLGDDIQMMKAGVMEIGDIFVVNKGDIKNAGRTARELEDMLQSVPHAGNMPPVMVTTASEGQGVDRLLETVEKARK